jgi:hypothetical protein
MVMTLGDPIPDAIAAVVAAVLTDHPDADPVQLGRLIVEQLRLDRWRISAPVGRTTTDAVSAEKRQDAPQAA